MQYKLEKMLCRWEKTHYKRETMGVRKCITSERKCRLERCITRNRCDENMLCRCEKVHYIMIKKYITVERKACRQLTCKHLVMPISNSCIPG